MQAVFGIDPLITTSFHLETPSSLYALVTKIVTELVLLTYNLAIPHFFAFIILMLGVSRFIPRLINHYGFKYFDYKTPYYTSLIGTWLGIAGLSSLLKIVSSGLAAWCLPPLALILVSLYGVWALDTRFHIIPDHLQFCGLFGAFGLLIAMQPEKIVEQPLLLLLPLCQAVVLPALLLFSNYMYKRCRNRSALGLGDIKLLAWLGLVVGSSIFTVFAYAMGLALGVCLVLFLVKKRGISSHFAFGPYIVAGYALMCLLPYLDKIGSAKEMIINVVNKFSQSI